MTRFFTLDQANERIPEARELLLRLRSQRAELIELRDRYHGLTSGEEPGGPAADDRGVAEQARLVRLRIKGIVDQMGASVARLDGWGITLRDIQDGLIDFPALVSGRQVWLCWRLGEDDVAWWHGTDEGFSGRRPLSELPQMAGRES